MKTNHHDPIGVFDSGLGGLTVIREIQKLLPHENIVYLGDLARLPYGTKSKQQIIRFSLNNVHFLMRCKVKAIVIACNSSSANAYYALRKAVAIPLIDVIRPASYAACRTTRIGRIGVIGTSATIHSKAYQNEIRRINRSCGVVTACCPLFVPLVEEGWLNNKITMQVIDRYLRPLVDKKIDTLILGCTHYPLLRNAIVQYVGRRITLIDSAPSVAYALGEILHDNGICSRRKAHGSLRIFVTDMSPTFISVGERFLNQKLQRLRVVKVE